ncbi:MAG: class I SAM-dependent methyltransferase [Sulfuritalea sp.]|nr:class I SAM-dependent methyltransferase [Sulfuritalea sp.]
MIAGARYVRNVLELFCLYLFGRKTFLVRSVQQDVFWPARLELDFRNNADLEKQDPYYGMFFEEIVNLLGNEREAESFLEVGCYYGNRTNMLAWRFPEKRFVGTDLNRESIEFGLKRLDLAPNMAMLEANAVQMPFPDNSFDVVYTIVSVSHMPHEIVAAALHEIMRVCRRTVILIEVDLFAWPLKRQISAVGSGYMFFHDYLAIAPAQFAVQKVVRLHCGETVPRYCGYVFSKTI